MIHSDHPAFKTKGMNRMIPRQIHSVVVYTKLKYGEEKKTEVDKERDKNLRWFN
jgi:hypothetical protein